MDYILFEMNAQRVTKVLIRTVDGLYLTREREEWTLTEDCSKAAVLDYPTPHLADQLSACGYVFVIEPVDALKAYETCDRCGRTVMPRKAFFDGKQFLCPECSTDPAVLDAPNDLKKCGNRQGENQD